MSEPSTDVIPAGAPVPVRLPSEGPINILALVERAARDPNVDVDKMERLLVMAKEERARIARLEYDESMNVAQSQMEPVRADSKNPQTRSNYASYYALDNAVRPIYTKNGFGLSFGTKVSQFPDRVIVTCRVSHRGGHNEFHEVDMPADGKGARGNDVMTKTHATGSALSYGQRYLLKLIFNIAWRSDDDDGNAAGATHAQGPSHPPAAQPPQRSAPTPSSQRATAGQSRPPAQAATNATDCPKCGGKAVAESKNWENVEWCKKCGWQWLTDNRKPYEAHAWASVLCPIPPKGTKKADYKAETLGQIARTDNKRFYGLVMNNTEAKAREGYTNPQTGKHYPANAAEIAFGKACESAMEYIESQQKERHKDEPERPDGASNQEDPGPPDDDVPF